jgi:hypothetical protein
MLHHGPLYVLIQTTWHPASGCSFPEIKIAKIEVDLSPWETLHRIDYPRFEADFKVTFSMPRDFDRHGSYEVNLIRCAPVDDEQMEKVKDKWMEDWNYEGSDDESYDADHNFRMRLQVLEWKASDGVEGLADDGARTLKAMEVGQEFLATKSSL